MSSRLFEQKGVSKLTKEEAKHKAKEARELGLINTAIILENYGNDVITFDEAKRLLVMDCMMNIAEVTV